MGALEAQISAALLLSLRIAPMFAFAPPFTLTRTPATVRVILAFALAFWLVLAHPEATYLNGAFRGALLSSALLELFLGITLTLALHFAFAALLIAGRTLDYQVGFGLSLIADPTLKTQMPLIGTLLAYAGGALFFASHGAIDLLAIWSYSLRIVPLGLYAPDGDLGALLSFISAAQLIAIGVVGAVMLSLFLIDLGLAFLSRTLPQMNVLVLGFQVKTITLLALTPFVFAFSGGLILRLMRLALEATPDLL